MQTPELDRILRSELPNVDACDCEQALIERARREMTYYMRLVHCRLAAEESHGSAVATRHARVTTLLDNIENCLLKTDGHGGLAKSDAKSDAKADAKAASDAKTVASDASRPCRG